MMYERPTLILCWAILAGGCAGGGYQSPAPSRAEIAEVRAQVSAEQPVHRPLTLLEAEAIVVPIFATMVSDSARICRTLARAESCDKPVFEVQDLDYVNAFASVSPAGQSRIALTRGLIEHFEDQPDELALVIGHQYAHLITGQVSRSQPGDNLAGDIISSTMSILSAAGPAASTGNSGGVYSQAEIDAYLRSDIHLEAYDSFSRAEEREADYLGTYLAARSGFSPSGRALIEIGALKRRDPLSLFDKLDMEVPFAFWDTHTYSADRAARIQETLEEIAWLRSKGYVRPLPPRMILELTDNNEAFHSLEELVIPEN
jgi:Zn-dependent protease with chaperone function